ncbi:MAG: hypothetical protein ACOYJB_06310 [Christensenellaceae bacterium]
MYQKKCEHPHKEVDGLIAELETVFSRSSKYSYSYPPVHFINISLTYPYLRLMKRLCANISFIVEQKQIKAWVNIIKSEIGKEFGPLYTSAYADFRRKIESCLGKYGLTSIDNDQGASPGR